MRLQVIAFLMFFALLLLMSGPLHASTPLEESLIAAWEQVQKSDPKTIQFDKIGDGRYKFSTRYFPFDGELKLVNAFIESTQNAKFPYRGELEFELVGVSDGFLEKYPIGYGQWEKKNYFNYQAEGLKWLTMSEFQQLVSSGENAQPSPGLFEYLKMFVPMIVLLFLFLSFGYYLHMINIHLDNNNHQWKTCIELLRRIEKQHFNSKIDSGLPKAPD